jgi:hypothetical protein
VSGIASKARLRDCPNNGTLISAARVVGKSKICRMRSLFWRPPAIRAWFSRRVYANGGAGYLTLLDHPEILQYVPRGRDRAVELIHRLWLVPLWPMSECAGLGGRCEESPS